MQDPNISQPAVWAGFYAACGAVLFTIRWLIGFGGKSAQATIKSQADEIQRLSKRLDALEDQVTTLQHENDTLRGFLGVPFCQRK